MNAMTTSQSSNQQASYGGDEQLVTFSIDKQTFGISALRVRDVLRQQPITRVPLASPEVAGAINLRGHIVTAINVRRRLGAAAATRETPQMCVVVEAKGDAFCLLVDKVGDVITINASDVQPNPSSLSPAWAQVARGVCKLSNQLLLLLDVDQLLTW